ncbi:Crp/Fnr family transcriptional regulator [Chitinophaga qingshengii]|uniref:Crp/Fnr family transcriptional regulator n=1 Tax=Chitinophaga qingshengii TaxID=1569794 RepID=A0ABR7TNK8_9BACT|nr:Crp/Fnr family transcriptional regulator [Chitinophaga qingshengii]MBC9931225.1 Crp/Fnr family transcriptional regulator [Chitinophaga qingshengii]
MKKTTVCINNSILQNSPLDDISTEQLWNAAQIHIVKQGDFLLRAGQTCQHIWLLEKGACRAFYDHHTREINTAFFFESDFITNMKSLRNQDPSGYHLQANTRSVLLRWHKDTLAGLYKLSPAIAAFGRERLELLAIAGETHADWLKTHTPEERYQYILQHQPELIQRVSITQLSSYIGISRETLSRIRRRVL